MNRAERRRRKRRSRRRRECADQGKDYAKQKSWREAEQARAARQRLRELQGVSRD